MPMLHALICTEKPGHLGVRKANREAHVAHPEADPNVVQAGPFVDAAGGMCGSPILLATGHRTAAKTLAAADPRALAGLYRHVRVEAWNRMIER